MIQATLIKNNASLELTVQGHAGGIGGHDLVCAAASMLLCTLAEAVRRFSLNCPEAPLPELRLLPGDGAVRWTPPKEIRQDALRAFSFTSMGFELLQKRYPRQVRLTEQTSPDPDERRMHQ